MAHRLQRRDFLASGAAIAATAAAFNPCEHAASASPLESAVPASESPFRYCLNMGTVMGHKLNAADEAELAAKAGYSGIEPWIRNVRQYVESGHTAKELGKRIADLGLTVEGAIGFAAWAVDDDAKRASGLEEFQRDMELIAAIGGKRIAASPAGINQTAGVNLDRVAQRYRSLLELGRQMGVIPQLEIWGSSLSLSRTSDAAFVAIQADHPDACVLLDIFHLFRGGSGFHGLKLLNGAAMHVFHMNDYPAHPEREQQNDSHRVFPGDGVAPFTQILADLARSGFRGALSLELFNRDYWQQDALQVARTGLEKMKSVAQRALANPPQ